MRYIISKDSFYMAGGATIEGKEQGDVDRNLSLR